MVMVSLTALKKPNLFYISLTQFARTFKGRPGQIARSIPIGHARVRKTSEACRARTFCLVKKKNSFDLQISSQIDKTMKKLP